MAKANFFIAVEGIDGSGKSTQVSLLTEKLYAHGHQVYKTFEPTDSRIGQMIRDVFSHRAEADHRTIAGLFVADRLNHLLDKEHGMIKKLQEGYTVVTDRYYFSSYAYHGTHMDMDWVIAANAMSASLLKPDLNIYIDVAPELSMERIRKNRESVEMYETLENLRNVRDKYFEAFEKLKGQENIHIIDGNRSPDLIADDIWQAVQSL